MRGIHNIHHFYYQINIAYCRQSQGTAIQANLIDTHQNGF